MKFIPLVVTAGILAFALAARAKEPAADKTTITVNVVSPDGKPVEKAKVLAIIDGGASLTLKPAQGSFTADYKGGGAKLFVAAPGHEAAVGKYPQKGGPLTVTLKPSPQKHSVILGTGGGLPGIEGTINPIKDSSDRLYMYSRNIGLKANGRTAEQPMKFTLGRPCDAVSPSGAAFKIWIVDIDERHSLVEYTVPK